MLGLVFPYAMILFESKSVSKQIRQSADLAEKSRGHVEARK